MQIFPQCLVCRFFEKSQDEKYGLFCKAYADGIPDAILTGEHDHREPYPGDNGIRFEEIDKEKNER